MRIISGKHRGLLLSTPEGLITRPTTDRVRENIFNILQNIQIKEELPEWGQVNVIDAFCGTGALGLESLSRGTNSALFIDQDKKAIESCRKNIESCKISSCKALIHHRSIFSGEKGNKESPLYSLIFLDPPYGKNLGVKAIEFLKKNDFLDKDALFVLETDKKQPEEIPDNCSLIQEKTYGRVKLQFFKL